MESHNDKDLQPVTAEQREDSPRGILAIVLGMVTLIAILVAVEVLRR